MSCLPSGENMTALSEPTCPVIFCLGAPLATSHSRTVASMLQLASVDPSGENDKLRTGPVCACSIFRTSWYSGTLHSQIARSSPQLANSLPSGEYVTQ